MLVKLSKVSKSYGEKAVLKDVNLELEKGEIHALLGKNGAGKSTLTRILSGEDTAFCGDMLLEEEGKALTVGTVYQEICLMENLTVAENLLLNREPYRETLISHLFGVGFAILDKKALWQKAKAILSKLAIPLEPKTAVYKLSMGQKKLLEAAREFSKETLQLLILDEPTDVLTREEAELLFSVLQKRKQDGIAILFISHKIEEVLQAADKISFLAEGSIIKTVKRQDITREEVEKILKAEGKEKAEGQESIDSGKRRNASKILSFSHFSAQRDTEKLEAMTIEIQKGEMIGFTGKARDGRGAILAALCGLCPFSGAIDCFEEHMIGKIQEASLQRLPMAILTEDRKNNGVLLQRPLLETLCFPGFLKTGRFSKRIFGIKIKDRKAMEQWAEAMAEAFSLVYESWNSRAEELSGGNQQKAALIGALSEEPALLICAGVFRGMDLRAKEEILTYLEQENKKGMTILFLDEDEAMLAAICHRVVIFSDGKLLRIQKGAGK